jgi:hypothetical protein
MKQNCWEVKKCGREVGGVKTAEMGVCPAATVKQMHGVHGGINGGRACWIVKATLCGGAVQGSFGQKFTNCQQCAFYKLVRHEEGTGYTLAPELLERMKSATIAVGC